MQRGPARSWHSMPAWQQTARMSHHCARALAPCDASRSCRTCLQAAQSLAGQSAVGQVKLLWGGQNAVGHVLLSQDRHIQQYILLLPCEGQDGGWHTLQGTSTGKSYLIRLAVLPIKLEHWQGACTRQAVPPLPCSSLQLVTWTGKEATHARCQQCRGLSK